MLPSIKLAFCCLQKYKQQLRIMYSFYLTKIKFYCILQQNCFDEDDNSVQLDANEKSLCMEGTFNSKHFRVLRL